MKKIDLYDHQKLAIEELKTGSILVGGVGSGKSRTSLAYFDKVRSKEDLYIITTARKRDTSEWVEECTPFIFDCNVIVDSWNNIEKYSKVKNQFFIFDEQRVVGSGKWSKIFIKIAKNNKWILLSATPGDTWSDYIPVLIANGYYKNRSEFIKMHIVYKPFMNYPVIDHYVNTKLLEKRRDSILVNMQFDRKTERHDITVLCNYDKEKYFYILKNRWNIFKDEPIMNSSELSQCLRKVVNSDKSRLDKLSKIIEKSIGSIIFYNFDYELEMLIELCEKKNYIYAQWNGHKHQPIPESDKCWVYLVQYAAGAEGWNCITTDTIIFYSLNHSYKMMTQAAGRIDRLNTPFTNLYYYTLRSDARIDNSIVRCLKDKKDFNENKYEEDYDEFEDRY